MTQLSMREAQTLQFAVIRQAFHDIRSGNAVECLEALSWLDGDECEPWLEGVSDDLTNEGVRRALTERFEGQYGSFHELMKSDLVRLINHRVRIHAGAKDRKGKHHDRGIITKAQEWRVLLNDLEAEALEGAG